MHDSQERLELLFEAALAHPPAERKEFLDRVCANSPQMRSELERLLLLEEQAGSFLRDPLVPNLAELAEREESNFDQELKHISLPLGSVISRRFTVNRFIASGGMGEVYEAWDSELHERVALKTIRPDLASRPEMIERFRREVRQARTVSHPNVCRVHELFCHEIASEQKLWFLSMEFLDGHTLSEHVRHRGRLTPNQVQDLTVQIVHGIQAAHACGVIHRDLKMSNIMLVSAGPGEVRAVLTDFGLALNVFQPDGGLAEPGGQGTPEFMAPEQHSTGKVTALADQYALGIIVCVMLTGEQPERNPDGTVKLPPRHMPAPWPYVIRRCMELRPEKRFPTLEELLACLTRKPALKQARNWYVLASVLLLAVVAWGFLDTRSGTGPTSLAVLPLQNSTGDASQDYLTAGISEALTNDLAEMPGLEVTAGSIARRYSGDKVDPTDAGRELRVRSVVSGSMTAAKPGLRVPIELIDVRTGREVFGKVYEANADDLPSMQHEISTDVAYRLKVQLDANAADRLKRQYATNSAAYDAYLKGRYHLAQRSPEAIRTAIEDFQRSLVADPKYAPAYAGLADCYSLMALFGMDKPIPLLTSAMDAAQHALELDSALGEAYASRAFARTFLKFDWKGAEADYRRAIELNPNYVYAHTWYGLELLTPLGRQAEAAAQMAFAESADPGSVTTRTGLALQDYFAGRYEQAAKRLREELAANPAFGQATVDLAWVLLAQGDNRQVIGLLSNDPPGGDGEFERAALLGVAYARDGQRAKALRQLSTAQRGLDKGELIPYETAVLYAAIGNTPKALDMLDMAYNEREFDIAFVQADPMISSLRGEPRFARLLSAMNLQQSR